MIKIVSSYKEFFWEPSTTMIGWIKKEIKIDALGVLNLTQ